MQSSRELLRLENPAWWLRGADLRSLDVEHKDNAKWVKQCMVIEI